MLQTMLRTGSAHLYFSFAKLVAFLYSRGTPRFIPDVDWNNYTSGLYANNMAECERFLKLQVDHDASRRDTPGYGDASTTRADHTDAP